MRKVLLLFLVSCWTMAVPAQNSKKVKALQKQKQELQNTIRKSQTELNQTKKRVRTGQQTLHFLGQQMDNRLFHIRNLEREMNQLDEEVIQLQVQIARIDEDLRQKKIKLKSAFRYARAQREQSSPLLFILSAKTFTQMYRRTRYAKEYATYQRNLGEQVMHKQAELLELQNMLLEAKSQKSDLLKEVMSQRRELNHQQVQQRQQVSVLKKQETGLAGKIAEQQKQLNALDKKIDELIAYEIEQARKRAEEAARKKALAEAAKKKQQQSPATSVRSDDAPAKSTTGKRGGTKSTTSEPSTWLTAEDRQLNGTFEQNRGRLPVPITGQYMLGNRFGVYNVPGLKNVQLDSKGTNFVGRSGARARAVFEGVVTAVFQFGGTKNILVRHGSYISVYCNLSSVIVAKGQKVGARDILGTVSDDGSGNCVLHFQLRRETAKLNPESWIGR